MGPVYVILGLGESQRLRLLDYLLRQGWETSERVRVYLADVDLAATEAVHFPPQAEVVRISPSDGPTLSPPETSDLAAVWLLPPGDQDARDWLEALPQWLLGDTWELARILTVIDCQRLERQPAVQPVYDAYLHFTDVALLGNRDGVSKKWLSQLERQLQRQAYPFRLAYLKNKGQVESVPELLYPEARRLSQFFDPIETTTEGGIAILQSIQTLDDDLPEIDAEALAHLEDELAAEPAQDDEADADVRPGDAQSDPFLARFDLGQRQIKLPRLSDLLAAPLDGTSSDASSGPK